MNTLIIQDSATKNTDLLLSRGYTSESTARSCDGNATSLAEVVANDPNEASGKDELSFELLLPSLWPLVISSTSLQISLK